MTTVLNYARDGSADFINLPHTRKTTETEEQSGTVVTPDDANCTALQFASKTDLLNFEHTEQRYRLLGQLHLALVIES